MKCVNSSGLRSTSAIEIQRERERERERVRERESERVRVTCHNCPELSYSHKKPILRWRFGVSQLSGGTINVLWC